MLAKLGYTFPCDAGYTPPSASFIDKLPKHQWVMEPKKDGWRCLVVRTSTDVELWNRHGSQIDHSKSLDKVKAMLMFLPSGTILDGELVHFRSAQEKGIFYAFDLLAYKREDFTDVSHDVRWMELENALRLHLSDKLWIPRQVYINSGEQLRKYYQQCLDHGDEGLVIKDLTAKYPNAQHGQMMNKGWWKIKPNKTFQAKGHSSFGCLNDHTA